MRVGRSNKKAIRQCVKLVYKLQRIFQLRCISAKKMKFTTATCLFFFGFTLLRPAHGLEAIIKKHHGAPADDLKSIG